MKGLALTDLTPRAAPAPNRPESLSGAPSGLTDHRRRLVATALGFAAGERVSRQSIANLHRVSRATAARDLRVILAEARRRGMRVIQSEPGLYRAGGAA